MLGPVAQLNTMHLEIYLATHKIGKQQPAQAEFLKYLYVYLNI